MSCDRRLWQKTAPASQTIVTPRALVRTISRSAFPVFARMTLDNTCPSNTWIWRSRPLANYTAAHVFSLLFRDAPTATLLESPVRSDQPDLTKYSICAGAPRQVNDRPRQLVPALGNILPSLRRELERAGEAETPAELQHLPFTGGWLGWLGYDVAWEIEQLPRRNPDPLPFPVAFWYEPEAFAVLDRANDTLWLAADRPDLLDRLSDRLDRAPDPDPEPDGQPLSPDDLHFHSSQADYEAMVRRAQAYIRAGDIFQTNLSLRFEAPLHGDPWQLYRRLHQINPSPFASYWQTPWGAVVSCSPERLLHVRNRRAQTRPIAGTRPRGSTPDRDRALEAELLDNRKENAEHIMLVDLERNDLGRVCTWGSVRVNELLVVERYSHVMHLVSNVLGELAPHCDSLDAVRALFPGGTITGCPKVRCMEIIEELEPLRRSLFYGSCGYLDRRGNLDLNILIRTLLCAEGRVWGQVGAGIVADSDPQREWSESLAKAEAQCRAIGGALPQQTNALG